MTENKKERKKQYDIEYAKKNLKRIPLDVRIEEYEQIKIHAAARNKSINGFIKEAIFEKINGEEGEIDNE